MIDGIFLLVTGVLLYFSFCWWYAEVHIWIRKRYRGWLPWYHITSLRYLFPLFLDLVLVGVSVSLLRFGVGTVATAISLIVANLASLAIARHNDMPLDLWWWKKERA